MTDRIESNVVGVICILSIVFALLYLTGWGYWTIPLGTWTLLTILGLLGILGLAFLTAVGVSLLIFLIFD